MSKSKKNNYEEDEEEDYSQNYKKRREQRKFKQEFVDNMSVPLSVINIDLSNFNYIEK